MIESALRAKLIEEIPELQDSIYPTNAPETATKPYLVYARLRTEKIKTLQGITDNEYITFMFSIMAPKYSDMRNLTKQVEDFLISLPKRTIGDYYIEDIDINNITEQYEHELKVNRGIIDFTIYFKEV